MKVPDMPDASFWMLPNAFDVIYMKRDNILNNLFTMHVTMSVSTYALVDIVDNLVKYRKIFRFFLTMYSSCYRYEVGLIGFETFEQHHAVPVHVLLS